MTTMVSFKTEEELLTWFNTGSITGQQQASSLEGIVKGGSVRRFYRLLGSEGNSLGVLMEFSREKEENNYYAGISGFLSGLNIPVPQIRYHDPELGLTWLEDLGSMDLHAFKDAPWPELKAHYVSILRAILPLWKAGEQEVNAVSGLKLMEGFGPKLYAWERDYFYDQYLMRFGKNVKPEDREAIHQECADLEQILVQQTQNLVHRDFQSHNIMMREAAPVFVDFQGMRPGTWFYDLASLLYDPYMNLSENRRDELLDVVAEMMEWSGTDFAFEIAFRAAAVQRLMQALGAYGYLGVELEKSEFLDFIPIAKEELITLASELELTSVGQLLKGRAAEKSSEGKEKSSSSNKQRNRRRGSRKKGRSSKPE
jgi:hypothetical protein